MNKMQDACRLSCEQWVASLPDNVPHHRFSPEHEEYIHQLTQPTIRRKLSKRTIRVLLIAAILLAISTVTVTATNHTYKYNTKQHSDMVEYFIGKYDFIPKYNPLTDDYKLDGFVIDSQDKYSKDYKNGDLFYSVSKLPLNASIYYNDEAKIKEKMKIHGVEAIYTESNHDYKSLIYNVGGYIYSVHGNISKEELIKVAQKLY